VTSARKNDRTLLTEYESKQLLSAYGIPTIATSIATSDREAVEIADRLGYPVVLKLHSETITHKTDVGGVQLQLFAIKCNTNINYLIGSKNRPQ
jgi:acetyltransferase